MRRAFTLVELLVVISVIALLISLALPALFRARKSGRQIVCINNMRQIGTSAFAYASDYSDHIFGFSWRPRSPSLYNTNDPELIAMLDTAQDQRLAQVAQAISIMRGNDDESITINPNWWPHLFYSHITLSNYVAGSLSSRVFICPEDKFLPQFRDQAEREATILIDIGDGESPSNRRRLRYRSSYMLTASAHQSSIGFDNVIPITQNTHGLGVRPSAIYGARPMSRVAFPSQKVWMFDQQDRHSGRGTLFYAEKGAAQPLLFFDGSVSTRQSAESNKSGNPRLPNGIFGFPSRLEITYRPNIAIGEAPALTPGAQYDTLYWFTAAGLRGVDFGGQEVSTRNMRE
jgi:prepilin-type N-terminal cleavage/methylation domain-containing protein